MATENDRFNMFCHPESRGDLRLSSGITIKVVIVGAFPAPFATITQQIWHLRVPQQTEILKIVITRRELCRGHVFHLLGKL